MLYVWLTTQLIYLPLYLGLDANGETQILDLPYCKNTETKT